MTTNEPFLKSYLEAFNYIEGMMSPDAALLFMAYNQLLKEKGIAGDVLEIGVHHGLSTIGIAALRQDGGRLVAIDLFEEHQALNLSHSGSGDRSRFLRNMETFFGDTGFIQIISEPSGSLTPARLGSNFSLCHIDGGHSDQETYQDLRLCTSITAPGGLICLDDYFNPAFPGVCEGAIRFNLNNPGRLIPIAVGFNKVLFQKTPTSFDLNSQFAAQFPQLPHGMAEFWGQKVFLFGTSLASFFDIQKSQPKQLIPLQEIAIAASLEPSVDRLQAKADQTVVLPVRVKNRSTISFQSGLAPIGLSYHLLGANGEMLRFDNRRTYFWNPLGPGQERLVQLPILAPNRSGEYKVEIDMVWEGITWFKAKNNMTPIVGLSVS